MTEVCAAFGCTVCLMHMKGQPRTMQQSPEYRDVKAEVKEFLLNRAEMIQDAGVASEKIWIDPGIGFGKTLRHNLELLHGLGEMVSLGYPVLIGVSR
jgi:dihydropteroate synthase